MSMILPRRSILTGLASLVAAPAIVRAENLMPVKALRPSFTVTLGEWTHIQPGDFFTVDVTDSSGRFLVASHRFLQQPGGSFEVPATGLIANKTYRILIRH